MSVGVSVCLYVYMCARVGICDDVGFVGVDESVYVSVCVSVCV